MGLERFVELVCQYLASYTYPLVYVFNFSISCYSLNLLFFTSLWAYIACMIYVNNSVSEYAATRHRKAPSVALAMGFSYFERIAVF